MNKNYIIGAVAVIAVVGVFSAFRPVVNVDVPPIQVIQQDSPSLGGIPGDTLNSKRFDINGVVNEYTNRSFQQGTSTLCVIAPPQATSTLVRFTAKNTSATSTTMLMVLEKITRPYAPALAAATTSANVIGAVVLAANDDRLFMISATSTFSAYETLGTSDMMEITPQQYLVYYAKNGGNGSIIQSQTYSVFSGSCNAIMQKI